MGIQAAALWTRFETGPSAGPPMTAERLALIWRGDNRTCHARSPSAGQAQDEDPGLGGFTGPGCTSVGAVEQPRTGCD